jgi:tetrahydromethanopterin S-methyltransferase subunit A
MSRSRMRRIMVTVLGVGAVVLLLSGMFVGSVALVLPGLCMLLAAIGMHLEGMLRSRGGAS